MRPFQPRTKQYWRVVVLCFVAASTFWLLNALNKSYNTQTSYPIRFVYDENELIPIKPLPEEVSINVTGKGWKLLRKSLRLEVQPAEVYIRDLPRNNYLLGSALRPALVNALDGLQLNFVVTDTVYFDFDPKVEKRIALRLDPSQKLTDNQHVVVGPVQIKPDSVTFTGPASLVDSLPNPFLLQLPSQGLTQPAKVPVPINYDYKSMVKANVEEAQVQVNVKTLVPEERQVLPELVNVPEGARLNLRPPIAVVRYQVLQDSVPLLNRDAFKVVLDYSKYNPIDSTLVPELVQQPRGIRNVQLWPNRIKARIRK
ncbi:hypothetical protein [Pontibacter actiniarum]|uniref:YbbR-like domain-containing protein n=1 Tax=Pontibacter actiniarum TaxID=323450 RepID=A0A1X9YW63_9BACT|nr:hypothetical protein [Pontibacter actiniarum]ARS37135.1 hypothetical protein CA264_17790 [Pontibacter actiniarum]